VRLDGFTDVSTVLSAGIYVLAWRGAVVYVGQSKSMYVRIYSHRKMYADSRKGKKAEYPVWLSPKVKGMLFDEVHVRQCALEELDSLERELIARYRPRYNQVHKPAESVATEVALVINGHVLKLSARVKPEMVMRRP
jgi:excinuclease UvrABC nuclease subunit